MRVKTNVARKRYVKKVLKRAKGFYLRRGTSYRLAHIQVTRSHRYATRDRKVRKREFRALWIVRLNAAARAQGIAYSRLIDGLKKAKVEVNRKVLADLAVNDPAAFEKYVALAKEHLKTPLTPAGAPV
ncbi:MAG: 50S ribosomal protein L20 [Planctomycetes bacterium]|nr:50S ribosomal protein L20 [Planctomycetota bacterium]